MSHTDPIADFLTRVRNASRAGLPVATSPYSGLRERVARALQETGFLGGVEVVGTGRERQLVATIKYTVARAQVFSGLERVSKPGRRVYVGYSDLKPVRSGLGVSILSTPRGVLTDTAARKLKVGGEILCRIW